MARIGYQENESHIEKAWFRMKNLDTDTIMKAISLEPNAITKVMQFYDRYMGALSYVREMDHHGIVHERYDPEVKKMLQSKLLRALPRFSIERSLNSCTKIP